MIEPELRRELLAAFEAEYREHLRAIRTMLDDGPLSGASLRDVFRRAHSLKGAARAVDLPQVEDIAHMLESLLAKAVERGEPLPPADAAAVSRGLDGIEARMRAPNAPEPADEPLPAAPGFDTNAGPDATLRVPATEIDGLAETLHALSEAVLDRERSRDGLAEAASEIRELLALWDSPAVSAAAASPVFVEFEQGLRQLARRQSGRSRSMRALDDRLDQAVGSLQAGLERIALVEADSVFGPLAGMARELGREAGAELRVRLQGMALRAERRVLQALRDPAIQLLRNAVSHGLQTSTGPGGPAGGLLSIVLSLALHAGRLELRVEDDGAGPDLGRIEAIARGRGLLPFDGTAAVLDEPALLALTFAPGFSTASGLDRLSGRGMGLSVVAEAARRLDGTVTLQRRPEGGTVVLLSVPLAARRQPLLLVETAGSLFGLPGEAVQRLVLVDPERIDRPQGRPLVRLAGAADGEAKDEAAHEENRDILPLTWLATLLDPQTPWGVPAGSARLPCVLLAARGRRCLVVVERLHDVRTLLVRAPDLIGLDRRLVAGIAQEGNGRPVLVLEPDTVLDRLLSATLRAPPAENPARAVGRPASPATILVVDDSITTRTLEKTILQAQGYRVLVAVDGLAALDVLRTAQWEVDVVVADVEMPQLDGFGLLAAMRDDPRLAGIPTLLMTSRNQQADIRRGLELGARAYIAKQDFDQGLLLATIAQMLP